MQETEVKLLPSQSPLLIPVSQYREDWGGCRGGRKGQEVKAEHKYTGKLVFGCRSRISLGEVVKAARYSLRPVGKRAGEDERAGKKNPREKNK